MADILNEETFSSFKVQLCPKSGTVFFFGGGGGVGHAICELSSFNILFLRGK